MTIEVPRVSHLLCRATNSRAVKLCTGTWLFLPPGSSPFPSMELFSITHKAHILQPDPCCQTSVDCFLKAFHILLYCLDHLQIQFLISYWLNFIFFFRPRTHLPFNPGFSSFAGREALISLGPAAMPFKNSSGQQFS